MDNSTQEPISRFEQLVRDAIQGSKREKIVENIISSTYTDIQKYNSKFIRKAFLCTLFLFLFFMSPDSGIQIKLSWIQIDNICLYKEYMMILSVSLMALSTKDYCDMKTAKELYGLILKYIDTSLYNNKLHTIQFMTYSEPNCFVLHGVRRLCNIEKWMFYCYKFSGYLFVIAALYAILNVIITVVFGSNIDMSRRLSSGLLTIASMYFFVLMFLFTVRQQFYTKNEPDLIENLF